MSTLSWITNKQPIASESSYRTYILHDRQESVGAMMRMTNTFLEREREPIYQVC